MAGNIIMFDVDDTMIHSLDAIIAFCNSIHNIELEKSDFTKYSIQYALKQHGVEISKEEELEIMEKFYDSKFYNQIKPVAGMKEVLEKIRANEDNIIYVTGRNENLKDQTIKLLERYYGKIFEKFFFTGWKSGGETNSSKVEIAKKYNIKIAVDDLPYYATRLAALDQIKKIFVPRQNWNTNDAELIENKSGKIEIIDDPAEILRYTKHV